MVTSNTTPRAFDPTAPKPEIHELLADVPGGEPGLVPEAATHAALKVWFTIPLHSDPLSGKETYELFVDDESDAIATRYWTLPIGDSDRYLELPSDWLRRNDGTHRLYYRTTIYNDAVDYSFDLTITLDTRAPVLANQNQLIFPPEVLPPNQLDARYLEAEDKVRADIPPYLTPAVGDVITWYWDASPSGTTIGGTKVLTELDYDKPPFIDIEGTWIRDSGDGERYAWYTVTDRAGNPPNGQSTVVRLIVNTQPVPRVLPPPKVVQSSAVGWPANGTLNPIDASSGVDVILNPTSVIYDDEIVRVRWGVEGELGYYVADPISPTRREYKVPKQYMAAHFGKVIPVDYCFTDNKGRLHESSAFKLTVSPYPKDRLAAPQCAEGSPLSLERVPPEGASITMIAWPFIAAGQQLMISVLGQEDATGQFIQQVVLDRHEVTPGQASTGIVKGQALIEKAFLEKIRFNTSLLVKAYVSFDNGETWEGGDAPNPDVQHFPWLRPKLIA